MRCYVFGVCVRACFVGEEVMGRQKKSCVHNNTLRDSKVMGVNCIMSASQWRRRFLMCGHIANEMGLVPKYLNMVVFL